MCLIRIRFEYINKYIGLKLEQDHYPESFDKLKNNFDKNYSNYLLQKNYILINLELVIIDGLHRASILKNIGEEMITCLQVW